MGLCVLLVCVIGVIRGHQRHSMLLGHRNQYLVHSVFIFLTVAHKLQIKVWTKGIFPPYKGLFCLGLSSIENFSSHLSIHIPREHNQVFLILFYKCLVYSGHIIKSFGISNRRQFSQIMVTLFIFGQKDHLIPIIFYIFVGVVFTNKKFTTHNGGHGPTLFRSSSFFCLLMGLFYSGVMPFHLFYKVESPH